MKSIDIEWEGEHYTIPANKTFELGDRIEEVVTLTEISNMQNKPRLRKLAMAYAELLNFAGARVTPQDIFSKMMDGIKGLDEESTTEILESAIGTLLEILMDGAPEGDGSDDGKKPNRSSKAAT